MQPRIWTEEKKDSEQIVICLSAIFPTILIAKNYVRDSAVKYEKSFWKVDWSILESAVVEIKYLKFSLGSFQLHAYFGGP